jgi:Phosphodiester glycosidase
MTAHLSFLNARFGKKSSAAVTALIMLLLSAPGIRAQVAVGEVNGTYTADKVTTKFHGYVVFIEQPGKYFTPLVTRPAPGCPTGYAPLLTTYDWAQQVGAFVAINGSFGDPEQEFKPGDCRYVFGPVKSNGLLIAPSIKRPDDDGNPAILFAADGTPSIKMATAGDVSLAYNVVSGQWEQNRQLGYTGSLLIRDGELLGKSALPDYDVADPRTAVGLTQAGTLILVVIEGRLPDSNGITLPALASLLDACGAHNAINLDGGGSSTITYMPDARVQMKETLGLYNLMKTSQHDDSNLSFSFTQRDPRMPFASRPMDKLGLWNYLYRPVTIHFGFAPHPPPRK